MRPRKAEHVEIGPLAKLWYDGWQDAHAELLPAELARHRTLESFRRRISAELRSVRVVGPVGEPAGLCMVRDDEIYQLYVAADSRGSGLAGTLLTDGEKRIALEGFGTAWLACAIGNRRAARFYEKSGWSQEGITTIEVDTPDGLFPLEVWRYEKALI